MSAASVVDGGTQRGNKKDGQRKIKETRSKKLLFLLECKPQLPVRSSCKVQREEEELSQTKEGGSGWC